MQVQVNGKKISINESIIKENPKKVRDDLESYLSGQKVSFDYEIDFSGFTEFQKNVLKKMMKIPYGKTATYSKLARICKNPKAFRAVGNVCNINPLPIIIPCHRVISSSGLGGYAFGIKTKKSLLKIEGYEKPKNK